MARAQFGMCSNEYLSILRAWNAIWCESLSTCQYNLFGPHSVCEEDDNFEICISGGLPNAHYNWTIIGPGSTEFKSRRGLVGNSQNGGDCLEIIDIPKYPYYPQYITIQVYSPTVGSRYIQKKRVIIKDCNGDDPTCEEYYGLNINNPSPRIQNAPISNMKIENSSYVQIYNYLGQILYTGEVIKNLRYQSKFKGILYIVYYDSERKILKTERNFNIE